MCVDPGLTTDSELQACGVAHAPLRAVLRARTFAVQIVVIGTRAAPANQADHVLWPFGRATEETSRRRSPTRGVARNMYNALGRWSSAPLERIGASHSSTNPLSTLKMLSNLLFVSSPTSFHKSATCSTK